MPRNTSFALRDAVRASLKSNAKLQTPNAKLSLPVPRDYQFPFELRHLVYFREVARQLHFRKAAETLAIAQPALSRSIAQLETALDSDLLNRTRRGVEITPAGRLLLDRLEPILRGLAAIPSDLAALAGGQVG